MWLICLCYIIHYVARTWIQHDMVRTRRQGHNTYFGVLISVLKSPWLSPRRAFDSRFTLAPHFDYVRLIHLGSPEVHVWFASHLFLRRTTRSPHLFLRRPPRAPLQPRLLLMSSWSTRGSLTYCFFYSFYFILFVIDVLVF